MTERGYLRSEIKSAIPKLNGDDIEWLIGLIDSEIAELRDTVEKLREVLVYFEDEAISSCPAEFVSYDRAEKFAEKVRFVLSDMRKGSSGVAPSSTEAKS